MKDKRKHELLGEHLLKRFKNSTNSSWQKWNKRDCWEFEITVIQNSLHWVVHDVVLCSLCSLCSLKKCQNRHPEVLRKYNTELIFSREIWTVCHRWWCEAIVMYAISIGCRCSCCLFIFRDSLKFYCNRLKPCNVQNLWNCRTVPLTAVSVAFGTMVQQTNFDDNASHESTQASVDFDVATVSDGQFKSEVQYIEITCITH